MDVISDFLCNLCLSLVRNEKWQNFHTWPTTILLAIYSPCAAPYFLAVQGRIIVCMNQQSLIYRATRRTKIWSVYPQHNPCPIFFLYIVNFFVNMLGVHNQFYAFSLMLAHLIYVCLQNCIHYDYTYTHVTGTLCYVISIARAWLKIHMMSAPVRVRTRYAAWSCARRYSWLTKQE